MVPTPAPWSEPHCTYIHTDGDYTKRVVETLRDHTLKIVAAQLSLCGVNAMGATNNVFSSMRNMANVVTQGDLNVSLGN